MAKKSKQIDDGNALWARDGNSDSEQDDHDRVVACNNSTRGSYKTYKGKPTKTEA